MRAWIPETDRQRERERERESGHESSIFPPVSSFTASLPLSPSPSPPSRKHTRAHAQNFIESECYFPIPDFGDEDLLATGELTGSLHGLVPKGDKAAAEGVLFRQQLERQDWSGLEIPPILLKAGVGGGGQQALEEAGASAAGGGGGGGEGGEGGGSSAMLHGRPSAGPEGTSGGRSEGERWGEGVVVGVAAGMLASACVAVLAEPIKRGMQRHQGYEGISGGSSVRA